MKKSRLMKMITVNLAIASLVTGHIPKADSLKENEEKGTKENEYPIGSMPEYTIVNRPDNTLVYNLASKLVKPEKD